MSVRTATLGFVLLLAVGVGACGRRGPPLPPLQVDPEAPQLLPLRQEAGQVVIRWYAPRLSSGGDVEELRLRKAIVSYRLLDLHQLAAEERAAERAPEEEEEEAEQESEMTAAGSETTEVTSEPEPSASEPVDTEPDPEAVEASEPGGAGEATAPPPEPAAPADPAAVPEPDPGAPPPDPTPEPETPEAPAGEEPGQPTPEAPGEPQPEEEPGAGATPEGETPAGESSEPPPAPEPGEEPQPEEEPGAGTTPEGETLAGESSELPPAPEPGEEPQPEEEPGAGETPEGETPAEESEGSSEPPPEEPTGVLLDYEDFEFEILSELDSEVRGEERILELPVEPEWVGRRLEVRVRYEARGGASEESEARSLDVTGPVPAVTEVSVEVGPQAIAVSWPDPRPALGAAAAVFADPVFEVFRRRGGESERLGRSFGPTLADSGLVWGEEVCYSARLVMVGSEEERVLPDPGPESTPVESGSDADAAAATADESGMETADPAPGNPEISEEEPAAPSPQPAEASWSPIPVRVPGTGPSALSVGPTSAEVCVTPVDVFPPLPPSDLRLFWQAERTEMSWRESVSSDVVGYHIYRSGPDGTGFERLTLVPVDATVFTDASRDPRAAYRYAVTAVDGADPPNESLPGDSRRVNPR